MAYVMSQNFVRQHLIAPSTASFPSSGSVRDMGNCRYVVSGYVDAQNGFGAIIRTNFFIDMSYDINSRNWRGTNIRMD